MTQFGKSLVWMCVALLAVGCAFVLYPKEKSPEPIVEYVPQEIVIPNIGNSTEATSTAYTVTGYYTSYIYERIYDGAYYGTTSCDAFIITKNNNPLTEYLLDQIRIGNTVNSITPEGNIRINLNLKNLDTDSKNKIFHSSTTSTIQIAMSQRVSDAKEAPACYSFVTIVEVK